MDIKLIFGALVLHFFALITPGPDFILAVKNALQFGRLAGVATAIGFGLGIAIHISYSIAGISLLLREFPQIQDVIRNLGALYLIWIGISSLWSLTSGVEGNQNTPERIERKSILACLSQGFLTNILNPKATLFILGIFTSINVPGTTLMSLVLVGVGMVIMTAIWFSFVSWIFNTSKIKTNYFKAQRPLNILFGLFFVGIGLLLLLH